MTLLSKNRKTICAVSGMSHPGKVYYKRQADQKIFKDFTSLAIKDDLIYAGASNGSVYVFESINGNFFKEIPFQTSIFNAKRIGMEAHSGNPSVLKVQVNQVNQLEVVFDDSSTVTLDQEAKQLLHAKQGRGKLAAF